VNDNRTLSRAAGLAVFAALLAALPVAVAAQQRNKAAQYYEDALTRYERNDAAGAVIQLKNALQQDPKYLSAYILLGRAHLANGEPADAEAAFEKALELGVARSEIAVPMAQSLHDQGKYEALLERFPVEGLPGSQKLELLVLRGHAHKWLGDPKAAARAFNDARAIDPKYAPALLSLADLAAEQGRRDEAVKLADEALALAPRDPRLWNLKGSLAHGAGDVRAALEAYGRALELDPGSGDPRIARASLLVELGRLDEAAADIEYVVKTRAQDPRAHFVRAAYLARRGDEAGMRAALQEVTRLIDSAPRALLNRRVPLLLLIGGMAHFGLNQSEKARNYLQDYLRIYPRHPGARKLLGSILLTDGSYRRAIAILESVVKDAPTDAQALALLASAQMARGRFQIATGYLEQALKASDDAADVHATLGFSFLGSGQQDLAVKHLERAFSQDRGQLRAGTALTVIHLKRGDAKRAVDVANAVAAKAPKNPAALNLLGIARGVAGDRKGSRTALEQAVAVDHAFLPARLNLAKLDVVEGNYQAARERLQAILKDHPKNAQAMFELAAVEERAGRPAEAIRWLERLRAFDPRHVAAASRLVDLYLSDRQPDKALSVAKGAEAAQPNDLAALGTLAHAHLAVGDAKGAQVILNRMTRIAGFDPRWQTQIATYQVRAGNAAGAAYSLEKAVSARSDYAPALALQAELDIAAGDLGRAEQRARAILSREPGKALGYRLLGDVALAKKDYSGAIASYRTALGKESSTDGALRLYQAYLASGSAAKGAEFMESWVREHPKDLAAMRVLAEAHLRAGNLAAARSWYERVVKAQGESPAVLNNLANILARQGDDGALAYAERAHRLAPKDAAIQDTLGWILLQRGDAEGGLRHLREARLRDPRSAEIRYHLAAALARTGRHDEARRELAEAMKGGAAFDGIDEARRLQRELAASVGR
jgi:putative PEP-CTERM system TPR-repeat lipoprotein